MVVVGILYEKEEGTRRETVDLRLLKMVAVAVRRGNVVLNAYCLYIRASAGERAQARGPACDVPWAISGERLYYIEAVSINWLPSRALFIISDPKSSGVQLQLAFVLRIMCSLCRSKRLASFSKVSSSERNLGTFEHLR